MTARALPAAADTTLEAQPKSSGALAWDAERPLEGWAGIEARAERGPWVTVVWLDSVVRRELEDLLRDAVREENVPYRLSSLGLGVGVSRWGRASLVMARLDAHRMLVLGTERPVPGLSVPGVGPLGRGAVVVEGVAAGDASWEAVAAAEAGVRAPLEARLAGQVAVSRVQALMIVPARWPVRGDGVIRWGRAGLSEELPSRVRRTVDGLGVGDRSPIVRVEDAGGGACPRWGWWQGVTAPMAGAPGAHAVRLAVDVPSLAEAQAHAAAIAWHLALVNAGREAVWPTVVLRRQLRRRLGDATMLRRHVRQHLLHGVWPPAQANANAQAEAA